MIIRLHPSPADRALLDMHELLLPQNGTAFHDLEHLKLFQTADSSLYIPNTAVIERLGGLVAIASIMGPFAAGKNGAKSAAIMLASQQEFADLIPGGIHEVRSGTTRKPEFRDGEVEGEDHYLFAHSKEANGLLAQWLVSGELVQWAQPRGDHVYFTHIGSYPTRGVALLDTVPSTLEDLDRALSLAPENAPVKREAIGIYRTVATFDDWWSRIVGRGDIIAPDGVKIDPDNYEKRMREAAASLTEALDMGNLFFFETDTKKDAGKAVIDIITGVHSTDMQDRGIAGAISMLAGLRYKGFKES